MSRTHGCDVLYVPPNKTSNAFAKPVNHEVGEAIRAWERVRPDQPALLDAKTGEVVHYLFAYRGRRVAKGYFTEAENLLARLRDVPTPAGPTPRQLTRIGQVELPVILIPAGQDKQPKQSRGKHGSVEHVEINNRLK